MTTFSVTASLALAFFVFFGFPENDVRPSVISRSQGTDIETGRRLFSKHWSQSDGLGPELNARACQACHATPIPGGAGTDLRSMVQLGVHAGQLTGSHVLRQFVVQPDGRLSRRALLNAVASRKPPSLFGIDAMSRVSEATLREREDPDDLNRDGISGRLARLPGGIGRLGWKATLTSVDQAVTAAFANELGLTNSQYPHDGAEGIAAPEIDDATWRAVSSFVASLEPPLNIEPAPSPGFTLFRRIGCETCHRASLKASRPVGAKEQTTMIYPYTDLLLHDMGAALADGIAEGEASAQEFRTPPLWGISQSGPPYLHDGRAKSIDEAIVAHDGEAARSATRYRNLSAQDQRALLRFVSTR